MCQPSARPGARAHAAIQQLNVHPLSRHSLEHGLVPVVAALTPERIRLEVPVAYWKTSRCESRHRRSNGGVKKNESNGWKNKTDGMKSGGLKKNRCARKTGNGER